MELATPITDAIDSYHTNEYVLSKCLPAISAEESLRQPMPKSNHVLWILGHLIHSRITILKLIGRHEGSTRSWLPLFNRGAALVEASDYPSWNELLSAWQDVTSMLHKALDEITEEVLNKPAPEGIPSADKKMSGVVRFFAMHEAYHAGQLGYLTAWLGHKGPLG